MQVCPSCGEENPPKFRLCGYCGATLVAALPAQEERRTVTIVFSDLKGSTDLGERLDPESLREVMTQYFDAMTAVLRRHGGTIEKFIGDAIMAVFGLPRLHEDDALRAVRAASEMRAALSTLNARLQRTYGVQLANRTGVNTGEVVAGDPTGGQRLVTGDAVNVAARLEQAAPMNEVLIGALTYQLVRGATTVEAVEPLELKGKSERVAAYRLIEVAVAAEGFVRRDDTPMVGRVAELATVAELYRASTDEGACCVATVIGQAGVGKSRLVREVVERIASDARVLRGRCLPYGEGITFWPLIEAVRGAAGIGADDPATVGMTKLLALAGDAEVAARVASAIGLSPQSFGVPEIFWAVRRLLEHLAARGPVVLVVDDIHWAETTFLDLLGHLLAETESQLFVLCTARNDLLERQPDWGEGPHQGRVVLQPLTDADVGDVVRNLLGGSGIDAAIQERIVIAAEGNPLFVEQLLSMLVESDLMQQVDGRWMARSSLSTLAIPPSLQALLSARLDQLEREERAVLEPASVIGLEFATEAVRALAPEPVQPQVETHLAAIQRRELIRPATSTSLDGVAYRFGHILIRDAAYQRLLKRARATLHARFAEWADATNRQRERSQEFEEILGYHLEQAHRYLSELGPLDDQGRNLGARAGALLGGAGRRAMARGDAPAAVNLLGRAAACLVDDAPARLAVLPDLGEAMLEHGELAQAEQLLDEAVRAAGELGEQRTAAAAELTLLMVRLYAAENVDWSAVALRKVEEVLPIFERSQDHAGLAMAGRLRYAVHGAGCRYGEAAVAAEQVMEQARAANDPRLATRGASGYAISVLFGPMPVPEAIERCERVATQVAGDRRTEALIRTVLAQLHAMGGDIARARELYRSSRAMLEELGGGVVSASTSIDSARIELLGGDIAAAERELRRDYQALSGMGERFLLATVGAMLGRVECMLGNYDEAETLGRVVSELAMPDDVDAQALWRSLLAICLARRGDTAEALELGRQAVRLRRATDSPVLLAEALADLAEVEDRAGHDGSAGELRHEALALYELKGDLVSAGRLRMLLS